MLKALRKKFILINMLLVFLVLVVVFSALCVSSYRQLQNESNMALQMSLNRREGQKPPMFEIGQRPPEDFMRAPVFVIRVNQNGKIDLLSADNISVSESGLNQIAGEVIASGKSEGVLRDYNLRFIKRDDRGEIKVAFIELSSQQAAMRNTIITSVLSGLAALIAFFFISVFLARWALRPVEQAWRQQRRFVADASHELKTPLTVILANIGILESHRTDTIEEQLNWIKNTGAEASRMKKLVDNLLFLARSDDAKTPVVHSRLNLSDLVFSTALAFESVAFERGVALDTEAISPDIHISGDEAQLRQLVGILLDNAVKYSADRGVVTLSLKAKQSRAVLSVHNGGTPLSREDLEHLFERFYRADKSRANEGYGLGLSIAKSIVENHSGKIAVESNEANGTVFSVILPVCN